MTHHYHDRYDETPSDSMYVAAHLIKREVGKNTDDKHLYNVLYLLQSSSKRFKDDFRYEYAFGPFFPAICSALRYKHRNLNLDDFELDHEFKDAIHKVLSLLEETRPKNTDLQTWTDRVAMLAYIQNHSYGKNKDEKKVRISLRESGRKDVSRRFKALDLAVKNVAKDMNT